MYTRQKKMTGVNELTETTEKPKERGTAWMDFYINWRFPISLIVNAIAIIIEIVDCTNGTYNFSGTFLILTIFFFMIDISTYGFMIFVYVAMRKRTPHGYHMNNVFLIVEVLSLSVSRGFQNWSIGYGVLALVIFALVWTWPNYIYFKHRKYLFGIAAPGPAPETGDPITPVYVAATETVQQPEIPAPDTKPEEPIREAIPEENLPENPAEKAQEEIAGPKPPVLYCKKCGARLLPDSVFCDRCGTKVN